MLLLKELVKKTKFIMKNKRKMNDYKYFDIVKFISHVIDKMIHILCQPNTLEFF